MIMDHYNPPSKLFRRASKIVDDAAVIFIGNDEIQLEFSSSGKTGPNVVTVNEYGLWNCTCENYQFSHKPGYGEYCCKHILAAIIYISRLNFDFVDDGTKQLTLEGQAGDLR